jgi:hypothetical protein
MHETFWTRRLERERCIWRAVTAQPDLAWQPGLFAKRPVDDGREAPGQGPVAQNGSYMRAAERSRILNRPSTAIALLLLP